MSDAELYLRKAAKYENKNIASLSEEKQMKIDRINWWLKIFSVLEKREKIKNIYYSL